MSNYQNFPSKIEVESNDIKAIKETATRISNWLHEDLKNIVAPLQMLREIPGLLSQFQHRIVEQFSELFKNQIETLVIARQTNIKILEKKLSLIRNYITSKEKQLKEAKTRIIERYKNLRSKLVKEHEKYLNNLDSHAYDIVEKIYQKQIQEKFSFVSIPTQNYIVAHTQEAALVRHDLIKSKFKESKKIIQKFQDQRKEFYDKLETFTCDLEPGIYGIPYYYFEIEDISTKSKRVEVYFVGEINNPERFKYNKEIEEIRKAAKNIKFNENFDKNKFVQLLDILKTDSNIPQNELKRFQNDCKVFFEMEGK